MTGHVYIVDDDAAFRNSLTGMVASVGFTHDDYADPEPLLSVKAFRRPGCVILDYRLPALSGLEVLKVIRQTSSIPVILISAFADVRLTVTAIHAGAAAVFEKPSDDNEFLEFIAKVCFEDRGIVQAQRRCRDIQRRLADITTGEREVLEGLLKGHPNKVIAQDLDKSVKSIERNRQTLIRKLGCKTTSEALLKVSRCPMMSASPMTCGSHCCCAATKGTRSA